jgi:hypothetical protein
MIHQMPDRQFNRNRISIHTSARKSDGSLIRQFRLGLVLLVFLAVGVCSSPVMAGPTLRDISRSFDHSVSQKPDTGKIMLILLGAGVIIAILVVAAHWGQRQEKPKVLNNPGRLIREIRRKIHLSNPQIKRLKVLADHRGCSSPLTVLLCPSLLQNKGGHAAKNIPQSARPSQDIPTGRP